MMIFKEWQQISEGQWVYGEKVRGIIRKHEAAVILIKDKWCWWVYEPGSYPGRGEGTNLSDAIEEAEAAHGLGFKPKATRTYRRKLKRDDERFFPADGHAARNHR